MTEKTQCPDCTHCFNDPRIVELKAEVAALERDMRNYRAMESDVIRLERERDKLRQQVAMDTQRFKEMEQHGLGLEAEVAGLVEAIQTVLPWVNENPRVRDTLNAALPGSEDGLY